MQPNGFPWSHTETPLDRSKLLFSGVRCFPSKDTHDLVTGIPDSGHHATTIERFSPKKSEISVSDKELKVMREKRRLERMRGHLEAIQERSVKALLDQEQREKARLTRLGGERIRYLEAVDRIQKDRSWMSCHEQKKEKPLENHSGDGSQDLEHDH
eukprot:TRINITY_DN1421_c0_g2_i1.p1 TRINITY_DN1421_c0_g2~~TRINITY_DN1421_c0_g2_i1.p1  ORF type:complete len:156 (-),score=41.74 TRINITY_DN1421_c0_g2_i1:256-723(-)